MLNVHSTHLYTRTHIYTYIYAHVIPGIAVNLIADIYLHTRNRR